MDTVQKAAAKGEELRKAGWPIKGIWVSEETETPLPKGYYVFLLKMDRVSEEQRTKLCSQIQRDSPWIVLFHFGEEYVGPYSPRVMKELASFLERRSPIFVWEAASVRKARKAKVLASNRRSGT